MYDIKTPPSYSPGEQFLLLNEYYTIFSFAVFVMGLLVNFKLYFLFFYIFLGDMEIVCVIACMRLYVPKYDLFVYMQSIFMCSIDCT